MAYVLKIKYDNNLRRLTLKTNELGSGAFNFAHLEKRIRELFRLPATAPLAITYTDVENDDVTMADDQDLKDALVEQSLNPLRIHVTLSNLKPDEGARTEKADEAAVPGGTLPASLRAAFPTQEHLKEALQSYLKPTAQIPGLIEELLAALGSQLTSAVKNGAAAAAAAASESGSGAARREPKENLVPQNGVDVGTKTDVAVGAEPAFARPSTLRFSDPTKRVPPMPAVHYGVTCDHCGTFPISGPRWKSTLKYDFDLCHDCYKNEMNQEEYTKIDVPKFRPRHMHGPHRPDGLPGVHPVAPPPGIPPVGLPYVAGSPSFQSGPRPEFPGVSIPPMSIPPMGLHGHSHGFDMRRLEGLGARRHGLEGLGGRQHWGPSTGPFWGATADSKLYARFVCDVTVFDGTEVFPGTHFVKIWRLRNSGSAPWPVDTSLVFAGGDQLGHSVSVPLEIPSVGLASHEEIEVSVDMVAPEKPGRYVSHWRLRPPVGPKFGQRLSVVIQVVPKATFDETPERAVSEGDHILARDVKSAAGSSGVASKEEDDNTIASETRMGSSKSTAEVPVATFDDLEDITSAGESRLISEVDRHALKGHEEFLKVLHSSSSELADAIKTEHPITSEVAVETKIAETSPTSPAVEGSITYPVLELEDFLGPIGYPVVEAAATDVAAGAAEPAMEAEVYSAAKALLAKLEAMGFTDSKLNAELLHKNDCDLRKTLDDLCAAEEWDPILEELEEMGFYDTGMNRRLLFKNDGSVKRVVKELVQMYRDIPTREVE